MSSGGGSGSTNTVTSSQQIPEFEQQASQNNQALAESIGAQPYPTYQAPLIQGMDPLQTTGQQMAVNSAGAYQPALNAATGVTSAALNPSGIYGATGLSANAAGTAQGLTDPNAVASYMNPYVGAALAPQIQDLQLQLGQQQRGIDATATQANAFGDARQGAASALQNLYGDQALNQLIGTGYNNAYTQALSALGQAQGTNIAAAQQYGNLANTLGTEQQTQLTGGQDLSNLGTTAQSAGLTGANAIYAAGAQNQTLGQSELNAAYQQYLNQVNWPVQMLNVQESALSNSPYNIATAVTLPNANGVAQGFGGLSGIAGLLGALGGSSGSSSGSPFGGAPIATGSKSGG